MEAFNIVLGKGALNQWAVVLLLRSHLTSIWNLMLKNKMVLGLLYLYHGNPHICKDGLYLEMGPRWYYI